MTHLGLFEGIGGFSLAARWAGWETVAWCEWNEFCQKILGYHFPNAEKHSDITKTCFKKYENKIDIITGGFPCQPFSLAGKRKGTEDSRHLWPDMLRCIREVRPTWVIGENVYGLVNWDGGVVFDTVCADLENEGFEVWPIILPACGVNAPHRRDRIWFIAHAGLQRQTISKQQAARTEQCHKGDAANAKEYGLERHGRYREDCEIERNVATICPDAGDSCKDAADSKQSRRERPNVTTESKRSEPGTWDSWPTVKPTIRSRNDGIPDRLDGITFPKWRNESIKAYGNAIVPQVAFEIFKVINQINEVTN